MHKYLLCMIISSILLLSAKQKVIMGTVAFINIEANISIIHKGFSLLKEIESHLSSYINTSDISKLNRYKYIEPYSYTKEIIELSNQYKIDTNGYFDITVGSITKGLYRFGTDYESIPSRHQLLNAKLGTINIHDKYIHIPQKVQLDLGGVAKGYAVDKLYKYLISQNIVKGIVGISGDMRCLDICDVDIQSPYNENTTIQSFRTNFSNIGISTSGTYNRFIKNTTNHHLINPKTHQPSLNIISATLVSNQPNSTLDAYTTAVSVMSIQQALVFLEDRQIDYFLIDANKTIYVRDTNWITFINK